MKLKLFSLTLLFTICIFSQYYSERTTEQNFEQSELYFNSHFLNTYGLFNFKNIAVGFFNEPFLNLYVNPASIPDLDEDELLIYLDFRGDRAKIAVRDDYIMPAYAASSIYYPIIDWRWFTVTRTEPEPIFSLGILNYPLKDLTKDFFIGGTYQLIKRQEKFYFIPYGIYYPHYYYDNFGIRLDGLKDVPITDRYYGKDDLSTVGHMFSAFSGYKINDDWSVGVSFNGVIHSRDGGYANNYQDGTFNQGDYSHSSFNSQNREQDYDHLDFSLGTMFKPTDKISIGTKIGYLKGTANQSYSSLNKYIYQYKKPNVTTEWSYNFNDYNIEQQWNRDGNSKYLSLNFSRLIDDGKEFSGYYRYTNTSIDLNNESKIFDTTFYTSRYYSSYDTAYYSYNGRSLTSDNRTGTGERNSYLHEMVVNFLWKLTEKAAVRTGIYYNTTHIKMNSTEPVIALRKSEYSYVYKNNSQNNYLELFEDKILEWEYNAKNWSLQIPIVFNFYLNEKIEMILGLNRILNGWEVEDKTTAYFNKRQKNDNGVISNETNFGERYTQPKQTITEDFTKLMAGLNVSLSKAFKINLLVDPEFDNPNTVLRLAQWWIGFTAKL